MSTAQRSAQRRAREKENLRRAILDAARELFVSEDYNAVTMRRIAEKIEYSPTAIYLYFNDKEEIFQHLIEEGFTKLSEQLEALAIADPLERLREGGRIYLQFAFEHPQYYRIMFQIGDKNTAQICPHELEIAPRAFDFIRTCVTEAVAQNLFREDIHPDVLSHCIWAAMHGAASLALANRLKMLPDEAHPIFYRTMEEMMLRGMMRQP
jgi:AcrR family transcriptional regulator